VQWDYWLQEPQKVWEAVASFAAVVSGMTAGGNPYFLAAVEPDSAGGRTDGVRQTEELDHNYAATAGEGTPAPLRGVELVM
jgi:hypothetical protein